MSSLLWGKVYYKDIFAGILREEPGDQTSFEYDSQYLQEGHPSISYSLPRTAIIHKYHSGLHPFFDNLVAEGWLQEAQTRSLGKRVISRFELLLAFGYDCAGAVSVKDPDPASLSKLLMDHKDPKEIAVFQNRASLSGVQPKLAVIKRDGKYYPSKFGELSTHIAKFTSPGHHHLIFNEYLITHALKVLLPDDQVVDLEISEVEGIPEPTLIIKRFERILGERQHFEEFNQLLERKSHQKYQGAYQDMSAFTLNSKDCLPIENYHLYSRIIAGFLLGNTDMHFKNFAVFHTPTGLRLTPSYDQVCAVIYKYKTLALALGGAKDISIDRLKAKNLLIMAEEFNLSREAISLIFHQLDKNKEAARESIFSSHIGDKVFKDQLIKVMEVRWKETFASIGQLLLKKQSKDVNSKE